MYEDSIIRRKALRNSACRGCGKTNKRNIDDVIYTYSYVNRGQNILFCLDCAKQIGELAK